MNVASDDVLDRCGTGTIEILSDSHQRDKLQESLETAVQYTSMAQNLRAKGLIPRAIRRGTVFVVVLFSHGFLFDQLRSHQPHSAG